jgi:hypothetical protein
LFAFGGLRKISKAPLSSCQSRTRLWRGAGGEVLDFTAKSGNELKIGF